jgi:hypothetical protein
MFSDRPLTNYDKGLDLESPIPADFDLSRAAQQQVKLLALPGFEPAD